jgi:hypothetical protein
MRVPNFLNHIRDNLLIVTPGDSGDIIICEKTITFTSEGITPHMFQYRLAKWAKSQRMRLYLLPELEKTIIPWGVNWDEQDWSFLELPRMQKKINCSQKRTGK